MFRRKKLLWQLYLSYLVISLAALFAVSLYSSSSLDSFYHKKIEFDLKSSAETIREIIPKSFTKKDFPNIDSICKTHGKIMDKGLTVILPSGIVIGDTIKDPSTMDNHADRPEIKTAYAGKIGKSFRHSYTLEEELMYVAVPIIKNGSVVGVVRAATPLTDIKTSFKSMNIRIIISGFIIAILLALVSLLISNRINSLLQEIRMGAERFAGGDFQYRVNVTSSGDLKALSEAMNRMAVQLEERIKTITRQKNELEAVLGSMHEAVMVVDMEEKILRYNQTAADLFGINPEISIGKSLQEVTRNPHLHVFSKTTLASTSFVEEEIEIHDPQEKCLQANGTTIKDAEGKSIGALLVFNDITRLKKLENIRRDFVSNVSHELKTPITSIKGFVETLKDGALNDPKARKRFLDIISSHSDRLGSIIEDLLSLSRIEQIKGKEKIELKESKLRSILNQAISLCHQNAKDKNIKLELNCSDKIIINVNAPFIEQAATNLIDNAIKYSETDSIVTINAVDSGDKIEIQVKDKGWGISEEHLSRIFERFYRVDKARSRKLGGTGLGLAIVKHIVQAHSGSVDVESTLGQGSTFTIRIPRK